MRTLLLMRGAPASGKSTWIKEHGLEPYTLEADKIRTLVANPELNLNGDFEITQSNDNYVWKLLFDILEKRMQNGEFTVIDATHSNSNMIKKYKKLIEKYQYRCYYKEFKLPLEELLERNANRPEYKRVPEDSIKRIYNLIRNTPIQNYVHKIDNLDEIINYTTFDLNGKFDKVRIIGDVHGCHSVLERALGSAEYIKEDSRTMYVFCGDLLDRGIENYETLQYMIKIHKFPNVKFVVGNHDEHLKRWAFDDFKVDKNGNQLVPRPFRQTREDLGMGAIFDEIGEEKLKQDTRSLIRRMTLAFPFILGDKKIFVCHAGVSSIPNMTLISGQQLVRGVGGYDTEIDELFQKSYDNGKTQGFTQVHGHRLTVSTKNSICLESGVEFGLHLSVLDVEDNKPLEVKRYDNDVYRKDREDDSVDVDLISLTDNQITNTLLADKMIKVKKMNFYDSTVRIGTILSLNFKKKAFKKGIWNNRTVKARGLFVDAESGDIVLRSYDKFFNLNENGNSINELETKMTKPLYAYKKYNGFLGIAGVYNGELLLATKSTVDKNSDHVKLFREVFDSLSDTEKEQLKSLSKQYNCSFVFEVCNLKDKHIIDFDKNKLYLLDAVPNTYNHNGVNIDIEFSKMVTSKVKCDSGVLLHKELVGTFDSFADLMRYVSQHQDEQSEGLVVNDDNGYMFKIKYDYYKHIKHLRGVLQMVARTFSNGVRFDLLKNEEDMQFAVWLSKLDYKTISKDHIIDAYRDYCEYLDSKLED